MVEGAFLKAAAVMALTVAQPVAAAVVINVQDTDAGLSIVGSGSIDVSGLTLGPSLNSFGGAFFENNSSPQIDILGSSQGGSIDRTYEFSAGTDFSEWTDGFISSDIMDWTYIRDQAFAFYTFDPGRVPGLGIDSGDLVGNTWTADFEWERVGGNFSDFGITEGTYTVTDASSGESISYVFGDVAAIPLPAAGWMLVTGLGGLVAMRRRKAAS